MTEVDVMKAGQEDDVLLDNVAEMIRGDIMCLWYLADVNMVDFWDIYSKSSKCTRNLPWGGWDSKCPGYLLKKAVNVLGND